MTTSLSIITAFLLFGIAILLFIISKFLHNKAGNYEARPTLANTSSSLPTPKPLPQLTFWERWKKNHPNEANVIASNLDRSIEKETENDVKEIIDAFTCMAQANALDDWTQIKPLMLGKLTEMVDNLGEAQSFELLDSLVQQESEHTKAKPINTGTHIARAWLRQSIEDARMSNKPLSYDVKNSNCCTFMTTSKDKDKAYSDSEKKEIVDLFIEDYTSQIMTAIGDYIHIPLFANGYDSPVAREIMNIMYSYLRNDEFIDKAKEEGIWLKIMFAIVDETNNITEKYCNADVQECIEYFNFPKKPVVTSRRCPGCGSRRVFCEDIGQYECMECGCQWYAPHDRNTYSRI